MAVCSIVTNTEPTVHEPHLPPPPSELPAWGPGLDVGLRSSEEETEGTVGPAQVPPRPGRGPCCVRAPGHCPRVTALSPLSVSGHSVDPGLAGLLGQRAPRSKQPFMVTFFRASSSPIRAPRAVRPLKRRLPKKTNELPQPNRLPGIFGEVRVGPGSEPAGFRPRTSGGDRALQLCRVQAGGHPPATFPNSLLFPMPPGDRPLHCLSGFPTTPSLLCPSLAY